MSVEEILQRISDPKRFGPGYWSYLHQLALDAETDEDIDFCIKTIYKLTKYIPCGDCNEHGHQHISKVPPESYRNWTDDSGRKRGMFKYSVDYHNHANRLTGAKEISYETALAIWSEFKEKGCKKGCGHNAEQEKEKELGQTKKVENNQNVNSSKSLISSNPFGIYTKPKEKIITNSSSLFISQNKSESRSKNPSLIPLPFPKTVIPEDSSDEEESDEITESPIMPTNPSGFYIRPQKNIIVNKSSSSTEQEKMIFNSFSQTAIPRETDKLPEKKYIIEDSIGPQGKKISIQIPVSIRSGQTIRGAV